MPKTAPGIPDELILAHIGDKEKLSDDLWLTPPQVGMLLGRSLDQLKDERIAGIPPKFMKPWGEDGAVRYKLGRVREVYFGPRADEYSSTLEAQIEIDKKKAAGIIGFTTFDGWLDNALPGDTWPFLMRRKGGPIDFFKGLAIGAEEDEECAVLTLEQYFSARIAAAAAAEEQAIADKLGDGMPAAAKDIPLF